MAEYLRNPKTETYAVDANPRILYIWRSPDLTGYPGIAAADLTALGIGAPPATSVRIRVIGASAPKPPRYKKRINGGINNRSSVDTFAGFNRANQAEAAGWSLSKRALGVGLRGAVAGKRTQSAIATLSNGALFTFPLNQQDFAAYAAQLGLQGAGTINATERLDLVRGKMSGLAPGKASLTLPSGAIFSTFYSTATRATLEADGWICTDEVVQFPVTSA